MPKQIVVTLRGKSPYSTSRKHDTPKLERESADDYDERTWREKANYDEDGFVVIPSMAFKQALDAAANLFPEKIPGQGAKTFGKHFLAGVLCVEDMNIGVHKDDMPMIMISANAKGVRGPGARVNRRFPQIPTWEGKTTFWILDDTITVDRFMKALTDASNFVGVGRFRPQNGGLNGRFSIVKAEVIENFTP